jgi:hypothetical protein
MKKTLLGIVVVLLAAANLFAGGSADQGGELRGTWYGGSSNSNDAGYKYQYTFIPTGPDRWYAMADGAYGPDSLDAAIATKWTGEVVKNSDGMEIRLITLSTKDAVHPPEELPIIQGVRGSVTPQDDGSLMIKYDLYGVWSWGQSVFEDDPAAWVLEPGSGSIDEVVQRMPMDSKL